MTLVFNSKSFAQSVLTPSDSIVEYDSENPPTEPDFGEIGKWVRTKSLSWNTDSYKAYIYKGCAFRLKFPKTYDSAANDGKKYPMMVFFHGLGEKGSIYDNELQLYHCNEAFANAVDSGTFDGYILCMQSQGYWGTGQYQYITEIIDYMVANNKLDPFHITDIGLSAGGQGAWEMMLNHPDYISAIAPMSSVSIGYEADSIINKAKFTPIWLFQGGLDGAPAPSTAQAVRDAFLDSGADFTYTEYSNLGHGIWDSVCKETNLFPFMLNAYSSNPWPLTGQTGFCDEDSVDVTMGVAPGFDGYQWRKNDTVISGATSNTITATSLGTYQARVLRGTTWSDWSPTPVVLQITPPTVTGPISVDGLMSNVITSGDGKNYVNLQIPDSGYTSYTWEKVGSDSILGDERIYTATEPGQYIVAATEEYGCSSVFSSAFSVIDADGKYPPDAATGLAAEAVSSTTVSLNWDNNPSALYNETYFEIYRSTQQTSGYSFIGKVGTDTLSYTDKTTSPGITYFYKVRAVNDSGAAALSNIANVTTLADTTAPSAPANLTIVYATNSSINIQWDSATDNVGVKNYQIYINGVKTYTTTSTSFTVNALDSGKRYVFYVKAADSSGNTSVQSNIASSAAVLSGLVYKYYQGYWTSMPDFNTLTPLATGVSSNVDISVRQRNSQFAFLWQGYINIPVAGTYKFQLISDDGSKLWLNTYDPDATPLINNDHTSSSKTKYKSVSLKKGVYPISIGYFQINSSYTIKLYWSSTQLFGDTVTRKIESTYFTGGYTAADSAPAKPGTVSLSAQSYNKIKVSWVDNSSNETAFQIYRSLTADGTYSIIHTTDSNTTEYVDSGLAASTKYYYRINAVNNYGVSGWSIHPGATTRALPSPPATATNVKAVAKSSSVIALTWTDNATDETKYKIYRSFSDSLHYRFRAELPANTVSYTDSSLYANRTYFYKVYAIGINDTASVSSFARTKTTNDAPVITAMESRSVRYGITTTLPVTATDVNNNTLYYSIHNKPAFATLVKNADQTGSLILSPTAAQQGTYTGVTILASDGNGGKDSTVFNLTVSANYDPTLDSIADYTISENDSLTINLNGSDQNTGDSLLWTVTNAPNNFSLAVADSKTAKLTLHPTYSAAGTYAVTVKVSDGNGGFTSRTFNLTVEDKDPNKTIYIRFKNVTDASAPWNNITAVDTDSLEDANSNATSVGLHLQTSWFATSNGGPTTGDNSGVYSDTVLQEYYYFGIYGGPDSVNVNVTGLDTALTYKFTILAASSWPGASDNGTTIFTTGDTSVSQYVQGNTQNTVAFTGLKADANGTITFKMSKATGTPVGYINALVITSTLDDGSAPLTPASLTATSTGSGVQLSWQDVSYNEEAFNIYRSLTETSGYALIGSTSVNTTSYFDSSSNGATQYYYKMQAVNEYGNSDYSNIAGILTSDKIPALTAISDVVVKGGNQLTIPVTASDDSADQVTLTESGNLPSFVTFTDNGDGTGSFLINPPSGTSGYYPGITITAKDNSDSTSTVSFNITVADSLSLVYLNFSDGSVSAGRPWNNLSSWPYAGTVFSDITDVDSNATSITVTLVDSFEGVVASGMQTGNNGNIYPDAVIRTGEYEGSTSARRITISGLSSAKKYNFVFFNSHDDGLDGTTNFTIGSQTVTLNATYNINKTVQINGITPDANGEVTISVAKASGASYAFLSSLVIQSYDSAQTLLAPEDLRVIHLTRQSVSLQWADRSSDETGFKIWRTLDSTGNYSLLATVDSNVTTYVDSNLTSGTTYYYIVQAVNASAGSNFSNAVSATTYSQAVYVNFTYANSASTPWNNTLALPAAGNTWDNLFDDTGIPSSISMEEVDDFAGIYDAGMNTGSDSGIFPDKVLIDNYGLYAGGEATLKITGLNLNKKYDFTFFASSQAYGDVNTAYTVNGKSTVLNASLNINGTATIYGITPDENGDAIITIAPNSTASQYGLIGALIIQEYNAAGSAPDSGVVNSSTSSSSTSNNLASKTITTEKTVAKAVLAYPSPFSSDFTLSLQLDQEDNIEAMLYDISGKLVYSKKFENLQQGAQSVKITPGQNLSSGMYLLRILYLNKKTSDYIKIQKQ
ncbi:fibronectin type III domain-containing protein [Parafilimonas sp.]|uniref:fibronectin type III domain-containing protein n=1 Tax=Parafilimonas sp. TaxID=1969739 RepID=UPI0039E22CD4